MRALIVLFILLLAPHVAAQDLLTSCFKAAREADDTACSLCERAAEENDGERKGVALLNWARCEENRGDLIAARPRYVAAKQLLPDKVSDIDALVEAIDGRVATLALDWSQAPPQTTLTVNGRSISGGLPDMQINPGKLTAVIEAPSYDKRTVTRVVSDGAAESLNVVPLERDITASSTGSGDGDGQRVAAYVVGGLGVAGVVLFAISGVMALSEQATVDEHCPDVGGTRVCANPTGAEAAARGDTLNIINVVGLGIGVAGLVTGLVLYLTAPSAETTASLRVSPLHTSLTVRFH